MEHWLRTSFKKYVEFKDEEWNFFIQFCKPLRLAKKETFLELNKVANKVGFLKKGILRACQLSSSGEIITSYFYYLPQNNIVTLQTSYANQIASHHYIEAITECEMLYLERDDIVICLKEYAIFEKLISKIAEEQYLLSSKRAQDLQIKNAKERYNNFLKESNHLILDVPQHMIASYLGISQYTLSKIKK